MSRLSLKVLSCESMLCKVDYGSFSSNFFWAENDALKVQAELLKLHMLDLESRHVQNTIFVDVIG